jgi:pimeloyl-ACP methyl ester carboxylesterase
MYGPMLARRNMLLVDQRGTGLSQPIDCPELQVLETPYASAAARCAARLGSHAHLYGTTLSADDLDAVITALGLGKVDVYGDSYGTFFTQVFAGRHPAKVRSLVLDSAYPTYGETAWYPTQGPAMRSSFDKVCARTPSCASFGLRTTGRISALLKVIRARPLTGAVMGGDLRRHRVTLDAPALTYLAFNATYGPVTYRELDAAIRAWFWYHDSAPLLRLLAEVSYPGGGVDDPVDYSEGLDAAVSCQDYPQVYDMRASPAVRHQQYVAAVRQRVASVPGTYAPFTISEYLRSDWQALDWCQRWPTAPAAYRQGPIRPPGGHYPSSVPVLVLSGELDSITTPAEGALVARQWPRSQHVVVANSFHVTAYGDVDTCAVRILRAFVTTPRLPTQPAVRACAAVVPPVRAAPAFRRSTSDAPAARPLAGSSTSTARLSAVRTASETVADLIDRWYMTYEVDGVGLRGGHWTSDGDEEVTFTLDRYRLVRDLAVSGTVTWNRYTHRVAVRLRTYGTTSGGVLVPGSPFTGSLTSVWDSRRAGARATFAGTLGGRHVRAWVPAP